MNTGIVNHEISVPGPIETPRQLLEALSAFHERWIGKSVSPSTKDQMLAEYDSIRTRATPAAILALELQDLVGISITHDTQADGSYLVTLSGRGGDGKP